MGEGSAVFKGTRTDKVLMLSDFHRLQVTVPLPEYAMSCRSASSALAAMPGYAWYALSVPGVKGVSVELHSTPNPAEMESPITSKRRFLSSGGCTECKAGISGT